MSATPQQICASLMSRMQSLQLSTLGRAAHPDAATARATDPAGSDHTGQAGLEPHIGYTPFAQYDNDLLIFVSQLSLHTRDLLNHPQAAVMLIDDEQDSTQIFARNRVSFQCNAQRIASSDPDYDTLLDVYEERHGKMVGVLRELPDFVLFRLQPLSGMFVMGFGKAFHLSGPGMSHFEHARSA